MATVRQDNIQLRVDFITDESRQLAATILETKKYNQSLSDGQKELEKYRKELALAGDDEKKRSAALEKIAVAEKKVASAANEIVAAGKKIEGLDLSKLTPAQLTERAKQLAQAMRDIPASAPQFKALESELSRVNGQLGTLRTNAKGIQDQGKQEGGQGGLIGSIVGRVAGAAAVIAGVWATLQGLFNFAKSAVADFDAGAKADAALVSRIQSTAGAAGKSLEELKTQAEELAKVTLFDDDATKKGQELLLTFTNIRGEVFDNTIPILQDLSTVMEQDISTSAVQVGKALNDPIKGITALTRVGVTFSDEQKKLITRMVETGDVAGAQKVILGELEKEFGGAARAAAAAGEGPMQILQTRLGEVKESIGLLIAGGLKKLQPSFEVIITVLEGVAESLIDGKKATGEYGDQINAVVTILQFLGNVLNTAWTIFQFGVSIVKAVAGAFSQLGEDMKKSGTESKVIEYIIATISLLFDAIQNLPATWSGVVAAIKQGANNIVGFFESLVLSVQIFRKEVHQALAFTDAQKESVARDLASLRAQKAAADAGKTIGQAYADARNAAIVSTIQEDARTAAEDARDDRQGTTSKTFTKPSDKDQNKDRNTSVGKAKKEADAAAGSIDFLQKKISELQKKINATPGDSKLLEPLSKELVKTEALLQALEKRLEALKFSSPKVSDVAVPKVLSDDGERPDGAIPDELIKESVKQEAKRLAELAAEKKKARAQELKDEEDQAKKLFEFQYEQGQKQKKEDDDARDKKKEKDKQEQKERKDLALGAAESIAGALFQIEGNRINQEKEEKTTALEKEYAARIAAAEGNSGEQQRLQRELEKKKEAIEMEAAKKRKVLAFKEAIVAGALAVIKALPNPLAAIAAGVAAAANLLVISNTKYSLGGLLKFAAGGLAKLAKFAVGGLAKFATGGLRKAGFFGGRPHSQGGTKGYFEDGTAIEVEKGEAFAIVNKRNAPLLRALSNVNALNGHGVPFYKKGGVHRFDVGGLPNPNTTPSQRPDSFAAPDAASAVLSELNATIADLQRVVANFPTHLTADVVLTDLEQKSALLNNVRDAAAL